MSERCDDDEDDVGKWPKKNTARDGSINVTASEYDDEDLCADTV